MDQAHVEVTPNAYQEESWANILNLLFPLLSLFLSPSSLATLPPVDIVLTLLHCHENTQHCYKAGQTVQWKLYNAIWKE
jgi:hypothetical protein